MRPHEWSPSLGPGGWNAAWTAELGERMPVKVMQRLCCRCYSLCSGGVNDGKGRVTVVAAHLV